MDFPLKTLIVIQFLKIVKYPSSTQVDFSDSIYRRLEFRG